MTQLPALIGAVATALVVSMTPAAGSAAAPEPVQVRPDDLSQGAAPKVAYINSDDNLVRPGRSTIDYGKPISHPLRAHHGYVVQVTRREGGFLVDDIYFVPDNNGARRLLWRNSLATQSAQRRYLTPSIASANGHLVLLDSRQGYLVVKRVTDGRTVASYRVPKGRSVPRPLAFRGNQVYLADGPNAWVSGPHHEFAGYLARWDLTKHRLVRVLSNSRAKATGFDAVAALDQSERQAALAVGRKQLVRPFPGRSGPRWRTGRNELVESWSPNGRFVLSIVAPPDFDVSDHDLPAFANIRIRRARTGALVAEFRGLLAVNYPAPQSPVWERDSGSILMSAFTGINEDRDEDPYGTGHGYVRCKVKQRLCKLVLPRYAGAKLPADLVHPFAAPRAR